MTYTIAGPAYRDPDDEFEYWLFLREEKVAMDTYQLWILNPKQVFEKLGPPSNSVDANLWLQALKPHCGSEIKLEPVVTPSQARVTAKTVWPGE